MTGALWIADAPLVLASGSVTRRRLLEAAGLPFEVVAADVDERGVEKRLVGASPAEVAAALARAKAEAVSATIPRALVLGADQVLSLGDRLLHKSRTREEGLRTLLALSGRTHRLTSAFALARSGRTLAADQDSAEMTLRALDEQALNRYLDLAGAGVLGSVGVYHWEGIGAHLFADVRGDHATILGLPILKLLAALRRLGVLGL